MPPCGFPALSAPLSSLPTTQDAPASATQGPSSSSADAAAPAEEAVPETPPTLMWPTLHHLRRSLHQTPGVIAVAASTSLPSPPPSPAPKTALYSKASATFIPTPARSGRRLSQESTSDAHGSDRAASVIAALKDAAASGKASPLTPNTVRGKQVGPPSSQGGRRLLQRSESHGTETVLGGTVTAINGKKTATDKAGEGALPNFWLCSCLRALWCLHCSPEIHLQAN